VSQIPVVSRYPINHVRYYYLYMPSCVSALGAIPDILIVSIGCHVPEFVCVLPTKGTLQPYLMIFIISQPSCENGKILIVFT